MKGGNVGKPKKKEVDEGENGHNRIDLWRKEVRGKDRWILEGEINGIGGQSFGE